MATNSMLSRGANVTWSPSTEGMFSKTLHKWWLPKFLRYWIGGPIGKILVPTLPEHEIRYMDRILPLMKSAGSRPRVAWIVFPSSDNAAHAVGVNDMYRQSLRSADVAICKYVKTVIEQDGEEGHTFAILSDHGEMNVDVDNGGNLDLCDAFRPHGLNAWRGDSKHWSGSFDDKLDTFGVDKDVLVGVIGDMSTNVYVKNPKEGGWKSRTYEDELRSYPVPNNNNNDDKKVDLIETMLKFHGVELVAWSKSNGIVAVQTTNPLNGTVSSVGVIELQSNDGRISYRLEENANGTSEYCPFGYDSNLSNGIPRSPHQWLKETVGTMYPYAVVRLIQYFTVPGLAPDMTVTALKGYDFGKDWEYYLHNFAGGHGGIHKDHITVPAIFSGANVKSNVDVDVATVEDVGASLHQVLLGSEQSTPSLEFLRDDPDDVFGHLPGVFDRSEKGNNNGMSDSTATATTTNTAAEQLVRGVPLSCLSR